MSQQPQLLFDDDDDEGMPVIEPVQRPYYYKLSRSVYKLVQQRMTQTTPLPDVDDPE